MCGNIPQVGDQFCVKCGHKFVHKTAHTERKTRPIEKLITCSACHKQTPLPRAQADWGTALACVHCCTPFIHPSDPENPLPTSPERLRMLYGLVGRGLEHPRCPFCHKINYGIVFPAKGMSLAWYAVAHLYDPENFAFRMTCMHCCKVFFVEWEQDPFGWEG
jgi:hypothetical protein